MAALPPTFEVPLFPLPGIVLFPGGVLPLRIFEPRYLCLLEDAMRSNKLIGMAHVKPQADASGGEGPSPVHDVLGLGLIVAHQASPDGTFHIALLGQGRYRICSEIPHQPYRKASVERLLDQLPSGAERTREIKDAQADLLHVADALLARTVQGASAAQLKKILGQNYEAGPLTDLLASIYVHDSALKQALLESTVVMARLQIVKLIMETLLSRLEPRPAPSEYRHENICLN